MKPSASKSEGAAARPVILILGFAPSPGGAANPSGALLPLIAANPFDRAELRTQLLPSEPEAALLKAVEAMDRLLPDAVIGLGVAEDADSLSVERVAINLDERGASAGGGRGEPIDAAGPAAYFSTLPVHLIAERIRSGGVPAVISNSTGALVANRLYYALLHYVALRGQETWFKRRPPAGLISRVVFIRLPASVMPGAGGTAPARARARRGLDLEKSLLGVSLAVEAIVDHLATPEGRSAELPPATD